MTQTERLWKLFKKENDQQAREALIIHYAWLVNFVVGRLSIYLPPSLEAGDLVGYGTLGLIEATDRFNLDQGVKFETYAISRIRGQIIDSLRALNLLPRSAHKRNRQIEQGIAELTQILGRVPQAEEVANHLGISLKQYYRWLRQANHSVISLDKTVKYENGEESSLYDSLTDETPNPFDTVAHQETKRQLVAAIKTLSEREQVLLSLYYQDELTMKEIGLVLGVSESRVSQMHSHIMTALRETIHPLSAQDADLAETEAAPPNTEAAVPADTREQVINPRSKQNVAAYVTG